MLHTREHIATLSPMGAHEKTTTPSPTPADSSSTHRASAAASREESFKVRAYLDALELQRPRRGPRLNADKIRTKLAKIEEELPTVSTLRRLELIQEQLNLLKQLKSIENAADIKELENDFIAVAQSYAERRKVSAHAFRAVGVPQDVLTRAGIVD